MSVVPSSVPVGELAPITGLIGDKVGRAAIHSGALATVVNSVLSPREESFREAVLAGLGRPKKAIPCKFLYDARGSALFEEICRLPEYYPTRTEIGILEENAPAIAERIQNMGSVHLP